MTSLCLIFDFKYCFPKYHGETLTTQGDLFPDFQRICAINSNLHLNM